MSYRYRVSHLGRSNCTHIGLLEEGTESSRSLVGNSKLEQNLQPPVAYPPWAALECIMNKNNTGHYNQDQDHNNSRSNSHCW